MLRLYPLLLEPCGKLKDKGTLSAILGMEVWNWAEAMQGFNNRAY